MRNGQKVVNARRMERRKGLWVAAKTIAPIKSAPATKCVGSANNRATSLAAVGCSQPRQLALIWAMVQIRLSTGNGPTDATSHTLEALITPPSRH